MSANVRSLTITGAVMAALTYIVCAGFVALVPETATRRGTYITHIDLFKVGRTVTWSGALIGGAFFAFFVAAVCASSGWLYNRLNHR